MWNQVRHCGMKFEAYKTEFRPILQVYGVKWAV